jgi:hypothetical protein
VRTRVYIPPVWWLLLLPASFLPAWTLLTDGELGGMFFYPLLALGAWRTCVVATPSRVLVFNGRKRSIPWDEIAEISVIGKKESKDGPALVFLLASGEKVESTDAGWLGVARVRRIRESLERCRQAQTMTAP